jgi:excinuclease ABC subunit C
MEILKAFLSQHYINKFTPEKIVLNLYLEEPELISLLSLQSGKKIKLIFDPKSQTKIWQDMSIKGAELALRNLLVAKDIQKIKTKALIKEFSIKVEERSIA